jgi:cupin superfamily acireductone dioxygenase involved in methionine salvage
MINLADLKIDTQEKWAQNYFLEHGKTPYSKESPYLDSLAEMTPWVPYEKYMQAKLIAATPGAVGLLHVKFPPNIAEDNRLHTHLYSDRLITVIEGSGSFLIAPLDQPIKSIKVNAGDRVWMPRGIRHTWYSGKDGLVVESIHNPFFAFDDSDILVYDEDRGYIEFRPDGSFVERKIMSAKLYSLEHTAEKQPRERAYA